MADLLSDGPLDEESLALVDGSGDDVVLPPVRADLLDDRVVVSPGEPVELHLQVLNTSSVIETLHVHLFGLMAETVRVSPMDLTLFPDESVEVTVTLAFHRTLPAGLHDGLLVVSGTSGQVVPAELPVRFEVPAAPAASFVAEPPLRTGRRKASYEVLVTNEGNTPLTMTVRAADADRQLALILDNSGLNIPVDGSDGVELLARRRRPWFGSPVEHVITVDVEGDGLAETQEVRFRQRARLNPGVITLLTLALIVSLWALAMYFGVTNALKPTPLMKVIPETFAAGVGLTDLDPTVVGGSLGGTVTAATTAQPLARVTVEAFDARGNLVGATATADDGSFEVGGLLPVRHRLRMRAQGFEERWWPAAPDASGAEGILVTPNEVVGGKNAQLIGFPGALGGQALAGDGDPVPITVEVTALDLLEPGPTVSTTADASGTWSIGGLAAPATYRVTYRANGYSLVDFTQPLEAGQQLVVNTTRLPAADGSISGIVLDREGRPAGGITVTAEHEDTTVEFTTPTNGEVGVFTLTDLITPATYLLTFVGEGFATETRAIRLGPGEQLTDVQVTLAPVTGLVTGHARSVSGAGLGGVTVTVSGGGVRLSTETLSSGDIGSFRLSGLPIPGVYAVTFDLDGYTRETVQISLSRDAPRATAEVKMSSARGIVRGVVRDEGGAPIGSATVEVSDGQTVRATTTVSEPAVDAGTFRVADLPPGTYTITVRADGYETVTVIREVRAAATTNVEITLKATS